MAVIADVLLIAGVFAAAFYCAMLARRLRGLSQLDTGLGAAIATLSQQVDEMQVSLTTAKKISGASSRELVEMTARAEIAAGRLELLLATLHERDAEAPAGQADKPPHHDEEKQAVRKSATRKARASETLARLRKQEA
ncbi:hypothetical protein LGT41_0003045 [Abyssibius alkaniclasticus]|uniref:hypothetical protein n=1 Tax=Abyssibius alkaniclasticus TaxID=2881234 RepID=UPI00236378D7|nr:hypothetical protein [Abyssibius alkaniclasticus]UPH71813.1 hypothetical protein LGT41_0003045 [Abyssibius alkaniclasticus]|tara:strand:- start:209 stop:622 length:414 start_codon:yes stop_codon:yes gene_type:complete